MPISNPTIRRLTRMRAAATCSLLIAALRNGRLCFICMTGVKFPFQGWRVVPGKLAGRLSPALGGFLGGQLGLLLFFFLFFLLLFLLVSLVFILLAAFFSHRMSPFLVYYLVTARFVGRLHLIRIDFRRVCCKIIRLCKSLKA